MKPDLTNTMVISWSDEEPMFYAGPDAAHAHGSLTFGPGGTVLHDDPSRVAPQNTPLADAKDPRIHVEKRSLAEARNCGHYGRGSWLLTLPDFPRGSWANTKGEAVRMGQRRLAILDWHASMAHLDVEAVVDAETDDNEERGDICMALRDLGFADEADVVGGQSIEEARESYTEVTSLPWVWEGAEPTPAEVTAAIEYAMQMTHTAQEAPTNIELKRRIDAVRRQLPEAAALGIAERSRRGVELNGEMQKINRLLKDRDAGDPKTIDLFVAYRQVHVQLMDDVLGMSV